MQQAVTTCTTYFPEYRALYCLASQALPANCGLSPLWLAQARSLLADLIHRTGNVLSAFDSIERLDREAVEEFLGQGLELDSRELAEKAEWVCVVVAQARVKWLADNHQNH